MTQHFIGDPTTLRALQLTSDDFFDRRPGGLVEAGRAKVALNLGDLVYQGHDLKWTKSLGNSYYQARRAGIVVGGQTQYDKVVLDDGAIGVAAAAAGERLLVMTRGICFAIVDAAGIRQNDPLSAGRTTAGRIRGDQLTYFARTAGGLTISAGTATLAETANATEIVFAGAPGTDMAAGLDSAALAGTVLADQFGVWEFRVAANGSTVTSAKGTDAATEDGIIFPAGSNALITYGYVIINPTGTGDFVGGTTDLNDGTVVPNAKYVDLVGSQAPLGYSLQDGGAAASALLVYIGR